MIKYSLLLLTILLTISCSKPLDYKYQGKNLTINCNGIDIDLAKEAYFSFREDLANYPKNKDPNTGRKNYQYSLAAFVYSGASGDADYYAIASPHTLAILEKLRQDKNIWININTGELNYNSEFLSCLINNIDNEDIKVSLNSLKEVNGIHTYSLAEKYRKNISDAETDNYLAMFLTFETYYKYLSQYKK